MEQKLYNLKMKILKDKSINADLKKELADDILKIEREQAINYSRCCTELNHDFKKGDDVWITSKNLVTIVDFTECGKRVQVEDGCEYYLVDIDEITKVV